MLLLAGIAAPFVPAADQTPPADLILHHGRIATVDDSFRVEAAVAVRAGRVVAVGPDERILALRGPATEVVDLEGRLVLPGLFDTHVHAADASVTEFDHPIPPMETLADVLAYIRERAERSPEGSWIEVRQVFITRLAEQRYPTRAELDAAAPRHAVLFATGPDASLNSLALRLSGIDRDFRVTDGGSGFAEKDPGTGEPTGILRNCTRYVKVVSSRRTPTLDERVARLVDLFADYNAVGITSICDRDTGVDDVEVFREWRRRGAPTVRVSLSEHIESIGPLASVETAIRRVADDPLFRERDPWLRVIGVKTYLDGGMLTGSAYMRAPWGVSRIYSITDPEYRGVRFIPQERLVAMVRASVGAGLQFTAHSVGDGAVQALLDAYETVNRERPVRSTRPCISHSNFLSREAIDQAARLGVLVDIQPAWLWLDTHTLLAQFGYDRLRYFQPLRSLFAAGVVASGGSDHMQKIGALRAVNPYHPFLGMATAVTRTAKRHPSPLHPEEALDREQGIRFYTRNGAILAGRDDELGSIQPGKLADLILLDTDLLTCPPDRIAATRVLRTWVNGRQVHPRLDGRSAAAGASRPRGDGTSSSSR
ncbi:MAG: amidohydrolase [Verrucomicrobiales bacterium]|nr:amidohydrolase [Verrucomicrobiales bacterium]